MEQLPLEQMHVQVVRPVSCISVCGGGGTYLLSLPILWQLSTITLKMDADLPLTSSGLETEDS